MSTEIFRKYIDIINEAQDFPSQAKALRQRRIDTIREWVYQAIEVIYKRAAEGVDMTDNIADELGDYFERVQRSGDPVLQRAYEMVRELADSTPEEQAAGALEAMKMLKDQVSEESELATLAKQHGLEHRKGTYGSELTHPTKGSIDVNRYGEWNHYPAGSRNSAAHGGYEELANYLKKLSEATGKKNKFVFFAVENDGVVVKINQQLVGSAYTAKELLQLLKDNNITSSDDIYTSSDVDFNIRASKMIEKALAAL